MPLTAGTRLGVFEILAPLGKGGMGEVYRAKDTNLEREVAVKILPEEMAKRPERMARFKREAKLLAALDHPHIAAIHALHEEDGQHFLVMELVDGETLADRLKRGALAVQDALELGRQIAEALEAAHEKDIIHRDLKPSNVMLTSKGKAKVLDFGLARAMEKEGLQSSLNTETTPDETGTGVIVGTAPYMSPEQARGDEVDERTDIWAFGCLLYESLTGKRAFEGRTTSDVIAAILEHEPDWNALPERTPPLARSLLRRCLQKEIGQRLRDAQSAQLLIDELLAETTEWSSGAIPQAASLERRGRAVWAGVGAVAALGAAAALTLWLDRQQPEVPPPALRLRVGLPPQFTMAWPPVISLSRDGTTLVYQAWNEETGERSLFLRRLGELDSQQIRETGGWSSWAHTLSPDGKWLAFGKAGKLVKLALDGEATIPISDAVTFRGASWGKDETIIFSPDPQEGLWRVPADGGERVKLTTPEPGTGHRFPQILPDGSAVLFTVLAPTQRQEDTTVGVLSFETGEWKIVLNDAMHARYVPTGHLIFSRSGALMAVGFDLARLEPVGPVRVILDEVGMRPIAGLGFFEVSDTGVLAYVRDADWTPLRTLAWVDRNGNREAAIPDKRGYTAVRLSPDASTIAATVEVGNVDEDRHLWTYDFKRTVWSQLLADDDYGNLAWSPDSQMLAFRWNKSAVHQVRADGSHPSTLLIQDKSTTFMPNDWSPDGGLLALTRIARDTYTDLWLFPTTPNGQNEEYLATGANESDAVFSPDGNWLAYVSNESGREEVYARPVSGPGARVQVSIRGGSQPRWAGSGELFYWEPPRLMAVATIKLSNNYQLAKPRALFEADWAHHDYDVSPDGQGFLMIEGPPDRTEAREYLQQLELVVVPNFFDELKAKMAEAGQ